MRKGKWLRVALVVALAAGGLTSSAWASALLPSQTALDPTTIAQFVDPMPDFSAVGRVNGNLPYRVRFEEFQQKVLPNSFYTGLGAPFDAGTMVFGYGIDQGNNHYPPLPTKGLYPGFTVVAKRNVRTFVDYKNNLVPAPNAPAPFDNPDGPSLQKFITIDQSIHWANPLGLAMDDPLRMNPYLGPHPGVAHLHGGEVPSAFDGGPEQWWTPGAEGVFLIPKNYRGVGFVSNLYQYPNTQEPTTLWFHDHLLGGTRLNVYAGLAAFYFLRGNGDDGKGGKGKLPAGRQEVEIVIQDRQFDTDGQLFWPDGHPDSGLNGPPPNPSVHPFWIPEFFGDVIVVNGKSWPQFTVEPRRYRLRLLEGSNARFYNLTLRVGADNSTTTLPFWVIGSDGGLLDNPVSVSPLLYAPGERYDVIVDFSSAAGQSVFLTNDAPGPYPTGDAPDPNLQGHILRFDVGTTVTGGSDKSYDPASGAPLRGKGSKVTSLGNVVRLPGTAGGLPLSSPIADGTKVQAYRQLTLIENEGAGPPGGPLEVFVNNSKWNGLREGTMTPIPGAVDVGGFGNWMTELPQVGSTEVWDIINLTMDAHPIHLHLVQFQIISRLPLVNGTSGHDYRTDWEASFPGGSYLPGYGPPLDYNTPNAAGALGGNPDVTPYLGTPGSVSDGLEGAPRPQEIGWKDTFIMPPGHVTRIVVRWTPTDLAAVKKVKSNNLPINYSGQVKYAFDPTDSNPRHLGKGGYPGGPGYVWHCHIVDHEDNEMMRPYIPSKKPGNTYP